MGQRRKLLSASGARRASTPVSEVREQPSAVLLERLAELRMPCGAFGHLCLEGGELCLELGTSIDELLTGSAEREAELADRIDAPVVEGVGDGHGNHLWEMASQRGRITNDRLA